MKLILKRNLFLRKYNSAPTELLFSHLTLFYIHCAPMVLKTKIYEFYIHYAPMVLKTKIYE